MLDKTRTVTAKVLASEWLELFNTTTKAPTKNKAFMAKHIKIDNDYRALSVEQQDKFHKLIHQGVNITLKPTAFGDGT